MHDDDADIINEIDALITDAASWSADNESTQPEWARAADGAMTAISLADAPGPISISEKDPYPDISRIVGEPCMNPIRHLRHVQFWVGDNSKAASPVNVGATRFLHTLLAAVRDGRYVASDAEHDYARSLLPNPDDVPVIHGPCVLTGVAEDGGPGPLDRNFQDWVTELAERHAQLRTFIATVIEHDLGISTGDVGVITVYFVE